MNGWQASALYGCEHRAPQSCAWCSGDEEDAREQRRQARERADARERLVRTNPQARLEWINSFPESWRADIAADADKRWGHLDLEVAA